MWYTNKTVCENTAILVYDKTDKSWCYNVLQVANDSLCFFCLSPSDKLNAKGITGGLADFRKRTCSRKEIRQYTGKPEE